MEEPDPSSPHSRDGRMSALFSTELTIYDPLSASIELDLDNISRYALS